MFIINVQPTGYLYTSSSSTVPGIKLSSTLWYYPAIPASDYLYTFFFLMECLPRFSGSLSHYPWHCVWNGACHESGYYTPKCFHCIRCPQCVGWSWLCNRDLTRSSDIRVMCIYISTDTVSWTWTWPQRRRTNQQFSTNKSLLCPPPRPCTRPEPKSVMLFSFDPLADCV